MKNKISQKVIAVLILVVFAFSNTAISALAVSEKPSLRNEDTIQLKADISITKSNEPVSLSLRDSDVKQVLRMFADKAGMNIIFDSGVSGTVTLDLVDVPLNSAFDLVLSIAGLSYVVEDNTLIVSASGADISAAKQEITMIPVKYVDASVLAEFLNKNIFTMKKPGLSNSEIVTTNPMTNELLVFGNKNDVAIAKKIVEKFDRKPLTTSIVINHTTPEQMANLICDMLIPVTSSGGGKGGGRSTGGAAGIKGVMTGAASSGGGGSSDEVELGGGEVACQIEGGASGSLTSLPLQTLVISYFTQQGTIGVIGGSQQQLEMIKDFIAENDKKQPQAYLELSIIELNESGSKTLTNTWQYLSKHFSFNASAGSFGNSPYYPIFFSGSQYPHVDAPENVDNPDYYVHRYNGPQALTYAINYILENRKGRVVANPRILITNGQESVIDLTSDYVKTVTSQVVSESLTGAVQRDYEIGDDNGIKISITPFISPDGYVTLNITPEYATVASQVTTPNEENPDIMDIQATLLQRRNLELKNVRIKDGETLVIGGMIREEDQKTVQKIPILGDIPGLGMFFRSTVSTKSKEEMLIMITPKIVVDTDDAMRNENTL